MAPSPREELANRIAHWLMERSDIFTAPIEQSLIHREDGGPGGGRAIAFGTADGVAFTLVVWNLKRLDFTSSVAPEIWAKFDSEDAFYDMCSEIFGVPREIKTV